MSFPTPATDSFYRPLQALLAALACLSPGSAVGQLVPASPTAMGMGGNYAAVARGFPSIGINPANLGLEGNPRWSVAFPVLGASQGLEPISLGDVTPYQGGFIPESQKEAWLARIDGAGGQTGTGRLEATGLALSVGPIGFQIHSQAFATANLNTDAAELLLFGNAGRTGSPEVFDLNGSQADGAAVTTFALGAGFPVARDIFGYEDEVLAVGANLTLTMGNGLFLARDAGSFVENEPPSVFLSFPILQTDDENYQFDGGSGFGLDLGISWSGGPWGVSATVTSVFSTFEWDLESLAYRPGEVVFNPDDSDTDTDKRPAEEAPRFLLDELDQLRLRPRLILGTRWEVRKDVMLAADFQHRFGVGIPVAPPTRLGLGVDWRLIDQVALQAGASYVTEGYQLGFGSSLTFGIFNLGGAYQFQSGSLGGSQLLSFGITFNAR